MADIPLDFGKLEQHGCFVGSHAVVVLSDQDDIKAAALNLLRFFEDESCGQCTPCRVGCEKAVKLMAREAWDEALLEELCRAMADASICGLGQAAPNPIRSVLKYFPDEVRHRRRHAGARRPDQALVTTGTSRLVALNAMGGWPPGRPQGWRSAGMHARPMALMLGQLYDALRAGNVPDDKARAAAEEVANYEGELTKLRLEMAERFRETGRTA